MLLTTANNAGPVPASAQHRGRERAEAASAPCVCARVHLGRARQSASQRADSRGRVWASTVNASWGGPVSPERPPSPLEESAGVALKPEGIPLTQSEQHHIRTSLLPSNGCWETGVLPLSSQEGPTLGLLRFKGLPGERNTPWEISVASMPWEFPSSQSSPAGIRGCRTALWRLSQLNCYSEHCLMEKIYSSSK